MEQDKLSQWYQTARQELDRFALKDWKLVWRNNSCKRCGACDTTKKTIELNPDYYFLTKDETDLLDTIHHEIAHALNWIRNGLKGHGDCWKKICLEVGCLPEACSKIAVLPSRQNRGLSDERPGYTLI